MASESVSSMILFIASAIIAAMLVGIVSIMVLNVAQGINERGKLVANQLSTAIVIVNDPCFVNETVYVRNVGTTILDARATMTFVDGNMTTPIAYEVFSESVGTWIPYQDAWKPNELLRLTFATQLPRGIHTLRVATEYGTYDTMQYNTNCP